MSLRRHTISFPPACPPVEDPGFGGGRADLTPLGLQQGSSAAFPAGPGALPGVVQEADRRQAGTEDQRDHWPLLISGR